ncbi:MAG: thioesterase [Campylobacterales bacterium]
MAADEMGLVHGGFTFSAADFAAMAAVNHPNVVLVGAKTRFLAPMKVGDEAIFEAKASHTTTKKRDVSVTAVVNGIKIFEGEFATVVLDRHVLKMSIT